MKRTIASSVLILTTIFLFSCTQKKQTDNLIKVDPEDSLQDIVRKSTMVVPSERQYQWQTYEFIAFLHYGVNTYTGNEWGSGKEDPAVFHPTAFDAGQWISVIKDAGMELAMLTAKHHDGFCLWPTTTTDYSVESSEWKNGEGDVFGALTNAAKKEGIKVGVYLSPADLHEIKRPNGTYGNGSEPKMVKIPSDTDLQKEADQIFEYKLDDYNKFFMNQLYELLTQYGPIREVWFDGANPKPGTGQEYNYDAWYDMIRQLQPQAVIAIKGPDVRWCGNEAGHTRKSEWSVIPIPGHPDDYTFPDATQEDLGSREKLKDAKYLYWYPAETNTSIREGWFYRGEKQNVKTVEELLDTWYRAVGGNTVFLLNLTPNKKGLIPEKDSERLRQVGRITREAFDDNLGKNATVEASEEESANRAENVLDGKIETFWKPPEETNQAELILKLDQEVEFNRFVIQEAIKTQGQRIEQFAVDVLKGEKWEEVATGTTVGYKNIRRFPMVKSNKVRLRILASRVCPTVSNLGIYKAPEMLSNPTIIRDKDGTVTISCKTPDPEIHYTLDGSKPDRESPRFKEPFELPRGGTVKAIAFVNNGAKSSEVVETHFDISAAKWSVRSTSAARKNYEGHKAIDGDPRTMWHTPTSDSAPVHPHSIEINLNETLSLKGFSYLPRNDGRSEGICKKYRFEVSKDGNNWKIAREGSFDNIKNNPVLQRVNFSKPMEAKYIRFTSLSNVNGDTCLSIAELGVITP